MTYIQTVDWHPVREARILGFCLEMMNKTTRNTKTKFSTLHPIPPHSKYLRALFQQLSPFCTNILLLLPSLGNPSLKAPSSYNTFSRLSILVKLLETVVNTHCLHHRPSYSLLNSFQCVFPLPICLNSSSSPVHIQ